jgi:hypothetical protein
MNKITVVYTGRDRTVLGRYAYVCSAAIWAPYPLPDICLPAFEVDVAHPAKVSRNTAFVEAPDALQELGQVGFAGLGHPTSQWIVADEVRRVVTARIVGP